MGLTSWLSQNRKYFDARKGLVENETNNQTPTGSEDHQSWGETGLVPKRGILSFLTLIRGVYSKTNGGGGRRNPRRALGGKVSTEANFKLVS